MSRPDIRTDPIWNLVAIGDPRDCWEWLGALNGEGLNAYGKTSSGLAHRRVFALVYGIDPAGLCVMHLCDNPLCCNPDHLVLGSQGANMYDRARKGRMHGEDTASAKVTEADALAMREAAASGESQTSLARRYQLSQTCVRDILRGTTWAHVGGPRIGRQKARLPLESRLEMARRRLKGERASDLAREYGVRINQVSYNVRLLQKTVTASGPG